MDSNGSRVIRRVPRIVLLVSILIITSCTQQKTINKPKTDPNLESFKKLVKENWDYTYERGYVLTNSIFYDLSDWRNEYADELKKLDTLEVKKLFGEPRKKVTVGNEIHWYYFKEKGCIPFDKSRRCFFYSFEFDKNGKCKVVKSKGKFKDF